MHTVHLLEQALRDAQAAGITVRHDWLGGATSGCCEVNGGRWLLLDLALSPAEQLELVTTALAPADARKAA